MSLVRSSLWFACVLAVLQLCACNAFDDPADGDSDGVPIAAPTTPNFPQTPGKLPDGPTIPPGMDVRPPEDGKTPCVPCGDSPFCADCGAGCTCSDDVPPTQPPEFSIPFTDAGAPGWRQSMQLLCAGIEMRAGDVWADERGVYLLAAGFTVDPQVSNALDDDDAGVVRTGEAGQPMKEATRVLHNEGSGWTERAWLEGAAIVPGLTGSSGSSLIVYGDKGDSGQACTLATIQGSQLDCEPAGPVRSVHVVDRTHAYALANTRDVLAYDGESWKLQPSPASDSQVLVALWADARDLIAVGGGGTLFRFRGGEWSTESAGVDTMLTAVWGTSADDLWVGTSTGGLMHYDGNAWQQVAQLGGATCKQRPPVRRIWGAGAHVWVHTTRQLARWDGTELQTFGNWSCAPDLADDPFGLRIEGLWGTAEDDVFILLGGSPGRSACGGVFAVHWDGTSFHRF